MQRALLRRLWRYSLHLHEIRTRKRRGCSCTRVVGRSYLVLDGNFDLDKEPAAGVTHRYSTVDGQDPLLPLQYPCMDDAPERSRQGTLNLMFSNRHPQPFNCPAYFEPATHSNRNYLWARSRKMLQSRTLFGDFIKTTYTSSSDSFNTRSTPKILFTVFFY